MTLSPSPKTRFLISLVLMACVPLGTLQAQNDDEFREFVELVNQYRMDNSTPENPIDIVEPEAVLTEIAAWMANDMLTTGSTDHYDSLGRWIWDRNDEFGYYSIYGLEIQGYGYANVQEFFNAITADPEDNGVILDGTVSAIGFSHTGNAWCVELGGVVQEPLGAPDLTFTGDFNSGFTLTWTCQAGYHYDVMYSETLQPGSWTQLVPTFIPGPADSPLSVVDNSVIGQTRRFYRIEYAYVFIGDAPPPPLSAKQKPGEQSSTRKPGLSK